MRYRHEWPGFLLLGSLALLLGGLLVWGDHFLSPGPSGGIHRLLQLWAASRPLHEVVPPWRPGESVASSADGVQSMPPEDRPEARRESPAPTPVATRSASPSAARAVNAGTNVDARYALEVGSFVQADDAERAETQLNQAGFSTVRFRQQEPVRLFSVYVPMPPEAEHGHAIIVELQEEGFTDAVLTAGVQNPSLRVIRAVPLRTAVRIAERLRVAGHEPRVAAEAAKAGPITLRHGNFTSLEEAEAVGRDISRLGVATDVVQIR